MMADRFAYVAKTCETVILFCLGFCDGSRCPWMVAAVLS